MSAENDKRAAEFAAADAQRDRDQREADKNVARGRVTNRLRRGAAKRSAEKTAANERNSESNDGAPDKPSDNRDDRAVVVELFQEVRASMFELEDELRVIGERDLADIVKRARREFELPERLGIPQARGL